MSDLADAMDQFLPPGKVLLVTSSGSMRRLGYVDRVLDILSDREVKVFDGTRPNPNFASIGAGIDLARQEQPAAIIALGGGSVIDSAKAIAFSARSRLSNSGTLRTEPEPGWQVVPVLAIPTTAGTGSEVTPWATIWDMAAKAKRSLTHPAICPRVALVDPSLTDSLPSDITASTGADALAHALESYWSRDPNPVSDALAISAVERIMCFLLGACQDGEKTRARDEMSLASLLAGMAFSNTRTAAAHSMSYPLTVHFDVPHGQACAIWLPALLRMNAPALSERAGPLLRALGSDNVDSAACNLAELLQSVGLATRIGQLGLSKRDAELVARHAATPGRIDNNVRPLSSAEVADIIFSLL